MSDYSMNELKAVLIEQIDEVFFRVRNQQAYPTRISVSVGYADIGGVRKQFTKKYGLSEHIWDYQSVMALFIQ